MLSLGRVDVDSGDSWTNRWLSKHGRSARVETVAYATIAVGLKIRTVERVFARRRVELGLRFHAVGVAAVVRLREAEAAHELARRELGEEARLRFFRAEFVDRVHDERRLHAQRGPVRGVHLLDLVGDEAVGVRRRAGAAVAVDRRAQQAERAHLAEDRAIERLVAVRGHDARQELLLAVGPRRLADELLVLREAPADVERVARVEGHEAVLRRGREVEGRVLLGAGRARAERARRAVRAARLREGEAS